MERETWLPGASGIDDRLSPGAAYQRPEARPGRACDTA